MSFPTLFGWTDDNSDMYVSGTHDPAEAKEVFLNLYRDEYEPDEVDFTEARKTWWDPEVFILGDEWIAPEYISDTPVEGWIPVLTEAN